MLDAATYFRQLLPARRTVNDEIRILLADDHPLMRRGLRMSIQDEVGLKVIAEAQDGQSALDQIEALRPDIALLDIEMPKLDGLEVARQVVQRKLGTKIIFLTFHTNEDLFRTAIALGTAGYILKDSAVQEVVAGIRAVSQGRPYLSSALTAGLLQQREKPKQDANDSLTGNLTPTELRIMQLIAVGKTSKEIGAELSIHYRTVENHRTNISRKLSLDGEGANALLRFALQNRAAFQ
jgi:DNA-binding NarL/FixJ family response regulator